MILFNLSRLDSKRVWTYEIMNKMCIVATMDEKLEKWLKWMDTTHKEIRTLHIHQQVFKDLQEMIRNNHALHKPSFLYNYLNDYICSYGNPKVSK